MSANWRYRLTARAKRDLARLDRPTRERVIAALDRLVDDPIRADTRKLTGIRGEQWRLRVGHLRTILTRDSRHQVFIVLRVLPRGRAYRR